MKNRRLNPKISIILILVLIVSCGQKSEFTYYENGNIKSEFHLLDSIKGLYTKYYNSGEKEIVIESIDRIKNGKEQGYYKSGLLKYEGGNIDGIKEGIFKYNDENGHLECEKTFFEGIKMFDEYCYNKLGNLSNYMFNSYDEIPVFEITYKNQKIESVKGLPFLLANNFHGNVSSIDSLEIILMAPLEKVFDLKIDIQILDINNKSLTKEKPIFEKDSYRRFFVADIDIESIPVFVVLTLNSDSLKFNNKIETIKLE